MVVGGSAIRVARHAGVVYTKRPAAGVLTPGKQSVVRLDTDEHGKSGGLRCAHGAFGDWAGEGGSDGFVESLG